MIYLTKVLSGTILDIGGGGEGIIGRLYGNQVVAIDNRQEELDEAPDGFEKILMDATQMTFKDNAFDHTTLFYTLMFMSASEQQRALQEATRVIKPHGKILIWDCAFDSAYPEPFCTDVEIRLPNQKISTTYGVGKLDGQNLDSIKALCESANLTIDSIQSNGKHFFIQCRKEGFQ